jgi:hypothetical protein
MRTAKLAWGFALAQEHPIRWYNPKQRSFEWRQVPESDDEALAALSDSPNTSICEETYREWRGLGASIAVALIRAGEAAKEADGG